MKAPVEILPAIAAHLGVDPSSFRFLGHSQNAVYEFAHADQRAKILRITASSHRSTAEIQSELDWVQYLQDSGLPVCPPVPQAEGSLVHSIPGTSETFHCVVFEKAIGRPLEKDDLGPDLYHRHGAALGAIHAASKGYPPARLNPRRKWDEERYFTTDIDRCLPEVARDPIRKTFAALKTEAKSHPASRAAFGPVHLDLGYSNFHVDGDRLEVFDFDNCTVGPLVGDLAAALYGSVFNRLRRAFPGDRAAFESPGSGENLGKVWGPFREGYSSKNHWLPEWEDQLPVWMEIMYFRAVQHACRLLLANADLAVEALLHADIRNLMSRMVPLRFDFKAGTANP